MRVLGGLGLGLLTAGALAGCLGAPKGEAEQRLLPRTSAAGGPAAASALALVVPRVPSPSPLVLGPASPSPSPALAAGAMASPAPGPEAPLAGAQAASAAPQALPSAEPTATPFVAVRARPSALRAFPIRSAEGQMYDCRHDPAEAIARWEVAPSQGQLSWGRFALTVRLRGEAPATGPVILGPSALGLAPLLAGTERVALPLTIPPIAEALASAPVGAHVLFRLEAVASGAQAAPLGADALPLSLEGGLDVQ